MFSQRIGKKVNKFVLCLLNEIDAKRTCDGYHMWFFFFSFFTFVVIGKVHWDWKRVSGQRISEDASDISIELISVNFSS